MDNQQRAKLDAYNRVADFNTTHAADLATITEFAAEKTKFDAALQSIKNAGISQTQQGTDQSISLAAKQKMADIVTQYCLRAGVKARSLGNTTLSNQLAGSANSIFKATKTNAIEIATNKRNTLNNNLAILTNISATNIADIDKAISAYNLIKDAPTETKQAKKSSGTDPLIGFFNDADDAENNLYELIVSYFSASKPQLVSAFETAKQIINTGIRSTSALFTCLADESSAPLSAFTVTDQSNNKTYTPDDQGIVTVDHHRAGHFHFTIASSGRTDVDFGTDIKKGTQNNFTIRLKKLA